MPRPANLPSCPADARRQAARFRDLTRLWRLRMLLDLGALAACDYGDACPTSRQLRRLLRDDVRWTGDLELDQVSTGLELLRQALEARAGQLRLPDPLHGNLRRLQQAFSIGTVEARVLGLAVVLMADESFRALAKVTADSCDTTRQLAVVLGASELRVAEARAAGSRLRRTGLLTVTTGGGVADNLELCRGGLRWLARRPMRQATDLFARVITTAPAPSLSLEAYGHVTPAVRAIGSLLREALATGRKGVNILLHGPPGTGKTELARVLSAAVGASLYEVASCGHDADTLTPGQRLGATATAQFLLSNRKAVVCFDEVDALFEYGSIPTGGASTADHLKAWVNSMLESNGAPTVWIANQVGPMDPAFLRRFDVIAEVDIPPQAAREKLLVDVCGDRLPHAAIQQLAKVERVAPASLVRAVSVAERMSSEGHIGMVAAVEASVSSLLNAQGDRGIVSGSLANPASAFDPAFCNASVDLAELAEGVGQVTGARICLHGPPGTGKTAFGEWLAGRAGRPHLLRRVSDLQSHWVGQMEKNLARTFKEAEQAGAVLQIDEVDSFLRDRRRADHGWEVSQVNEFLLQLESFRGVFIASTNLMDGLDPAALRRFDYRVRLAPLHAEQAAALVARCLQELGIAHGPEDLSRAKRIEMVVPGDCAVLLRRHRVVPFRRAGDFIEALHEEVSGRVRTARIGFLP
ncbi:AAA family ATPase [Luteimonas pelagia]